MSKLASERTRELMRRRASSESTDFRCANFWDLARCVLLITAEVKMSLKATHSRRFPLKVGICNLGSLMSLECGTAEDVGIAVGAGTGKLLLIPCTWLWIAMARSSSRSNSF